MANYGPPGGPEPWPGRHPNDPYRHPAGPWEPAEPDEEPGYPDQGRYRYGPESARPPARPEHGSRWTPEYGQPEHDRGYGPSPGYGQPGYGPPRYEPYGSPEYGPAYGPPEYRPPDRNRRDYDPPEYGQPRPEYRSTFHPAAGQTSFDRPREFGPPPGYPVAPGDDDRLDPPPRAGARGRGPLLAVLGTLAVLVFGGGAAIYYLRGQEDAPTPSTAATSTVPDGSPTVAAQPSVEPSSSTPAVESSTDPRFVRAGQCVRNEGPASGQPKLAIAPCGAGTYQVLRRFDGATSGEKDAEAKCAKVEGYTNWYFFNSPLDTLDFVLCLKSR